MVIAFPLQQWLHEHASVLRHTVSCLSWIFHEMHYVLSVVLPYYTQNHDFVFCLLAVVEWVLPCFWSLCKSWHSSDGIVTTLWNGRTKNLGHGSTLGMKQEIFFPFPKCLDWLWGPPNLLCKMYVGFFTLGAKRPGREAASSGSEVRNEWSYT
jgi:hypothetical protein